MSLATLFVAVTAISACGGGPEEQDSAPTIVTESVRAATAGAAYAEQLQAEGGTAPLTWSLTAPAQLQWLRLSSDGKLTGTPAEPLRPAVTFTVTVKDAAGKSASRDLSMEVQSCTEGTTRECGVPIAEACLVGTQICEGGRFSTCMDGAPSVDVANCGPDCAGCGESGDACAEGSCRCGEGPGCGEGADGCCGGNCVDRQTDATNCGACGNSCFDRDGNGQIDTPSGTAPACTEGACTYPCAVGHQKCDQTSEICINVTNDVANCGACGVACAQNLPGTERSTCESGTCGVVCKPGFADCDGNAANGCEVNLTSDAQHCGTCQTACQAGGATSTCQNSTCQFTCNPGFANVDGNTANGCEVNLMTDVKHCGAINNVCPSGAYSTPTCSQGNCGISCSSGRGNCNGLAADGCEVNLTSNVNHCGGCGNVCTAPADQCDNSSCCEMYQVPGQTPRCL